VIPPRCRLIVEECSQIEDRRSTRETRRRWCHSRPPNPLARWPADESACPTRSSCSCLPPRRYSPSSRSKRHVSRSAISRSRRRIARVTTIVAVERLHHNRERRPAMQITPNVTLELRVRKC